MGFGVLLTLTIYIVNEAVNIDVDLCYPRLVLTIIADFLWGMTPRKKKNFTQVSTKRSSGQKATSAVVVAIYWVVNQNSPTISVGDQVFVTSVDNALIGVGLSSCMFFLTLIVERMKFLFTPYIVIFATIFFGNKGVYSQLSKLFGELISLGIDQFSTTSLPEGDKKSIVCQRFCVISRIVDWSRQAIVVAVTLKAAIEVCFDWLLSSVFFSSFFVLPENVVWYYHRIY